MMAARGQEADERRPAMIVSNDGANGAAERLQRGVITVVPLASNVRRVREFQVLVEAGLAGLDLDSKSQCEQLRVVPVEAVGPLVGRLPDDLVHRVDRAPRVHLDL